MNKTLFSILKYTLFLGIGLGLLYFAYRGVKFSEILESASNAKWPWVILSFGLGYVAMIIRGIRWNILLEPLGYRVKPWAAVHSVAFGYFMNNLVPRSGELARCGLLNRAEKVPIDKLFGTVILERIVDVLLLGFFVGFAFLTHTEELDSLFGKIGQLREGGEKSNLMLYLGILAVAGIIGAWVVFRFFSHISFVQRLREFMAGIGHGLRSVLKLRRKWLFIAYSLGIWITWILMSQCMMYALEETRDLSIVDTVFFVVAASFGMLVPTPGGLGSYHITARLGMEALGLSAAVGVTYGTITWLGKTALEIIAGAIGFFVV
ncbi:MAG: hypothetical protein RL220_1493, partial [Bacteroidota bacterium]